MFTRVQSQMGIIKTFLLVLLVSNTYAQDKILYEDDTIIVKYSGAYSKRTGNPLQFRQAPNWEEEDFFTQQEKYCEIGEKDGIQR